MGTRGGRGKETETNRETDRWVCRDERDRERSTVCMKEGISIKEFQVQFLSL